MSFDRIAPFPGSRRTDVERFRDYLLDRRSRVDPADRLIRLPGVHSVSPGLGPPAGMFRIHAEGARDRHARR